jgi:hypothetical protein
VSETLTFQHGKIPAAGRHRATSFGVSFARRVLERSANSVDLRATATAEPTVEFLRIGYGAVSRIFCTFIARCAAKKA